jgi:dCTP deaminase
MMTLLNDTQIKKLANAGMITPFVPELIRRVEDRIHPVISYGISSYGYDLRLSPTEFKVFRHLPGTVINPKAFNPLNLESVPLYTDEWGSYYVLPHHSYGLGVAKECLELPPCITALFIGKSTYARCGVIANLTPGEAGWRGHLTLEFSNASDADVRIYANEGIVQALFFQGDPCSTSYEDRSGKYQNQLETVTIAKA